MKKFIFKPKDHIPLLITVSFLVVLGGCYFLIPEFQQTVNEAFQVFKSGDQQKIHDLISQLGAWGPFIIVVAMVMQMFLIVIPSVLLMLVATLAYGPWWGSLLAFSSILVASSIGYWMGNFAHESIVDRLIGKKTKEKMNHYMEVYGAWVVVIARINPFLSNDAVSFLAGLGKMKYIKFILATSAGILPLIVLLAFLGENLDQLKVILLWISGIGVLAGLVYFLYRKKFKKNN